MKSNDRNHLDFFIRVSGDMYFYPMLYLLCAIKIMQKHLSKTNFIIFVLEITKDIFSWYWIFLFSFPYEYCHAQSLTCITNVLLLHLLIHFTIRWSQINMLIHLLQCPLWFTFYDSIKKYLLSPPSFQLCDS